MPRREWLNLFDGDGDDFIPVCFHNGYLGNYTMRRFTRYNIWDALDSRPGWHHLAVVASSDFGTRYYVDAEEVAHHDGVGKGRVKSVGNRGDGACRDSFAMSDFALWGAAATPEQIHSLFTPQLQDVSHFEGESLAVKFKDLNDAKDAGFLSITEHEDAVRSLLQSSGPVTAQDPVGRAVAYLNRGLLDLKIDFQLLETMIRDANYSNGSWDAICTHPHAGALVENATELMPGLCTESLLALLLKIEALAAPAVDQNRARVAKEPVGVHPGEAEHLARAGRGDVKGWKLLTRHNFSDGVFRQSQYAPTPSPPRFLSPLLLSVSLWLLLSISSSYSVTHGPDTPAMTIRVRHSTRIWRLITMNFGHPITMILFSKWCVGPSYTLASQCRALTQLLGC